MSKTNAALLVGVGALVVVTYVAMKNRGAATPAVPGPAASPTALRPSPDPAPGRVSDQDWLAAGTSLATSIINNWGKGSKPAGA